jgi:hypothetical protein
MMSIDESDLQFLFDEEIWAWAIDYDPKGNQSASPCALFKKLHPNATDIDIVAISHNNTVLFLEIKGYFLRSNKTETAQIDILKNVQKHLLKDQFTLVEEIAKNVNDSTLAIIGAARTHKINTAEWQKVAKAIGDSEKRFIVVAWIEEDYPHLNNSLKIQEEAKARTAIYQSLLRKELAWLTPAVDILVLNTYLYDNDIAGLDVKRINQ